MQEFLKKSRLLLDSVSGKSLSEKERIEKAKLLATYLLEGANKAKTWKEKQQDKEINRLIFDPKGKAFAAGVADQAFRSTNPIRTVDQISFLIKKLGIPQFLPETLRIGFILFHLLGKIFPSFFVKQLKRNLKKTMGRVLLPESEDEREAFMRAFRQDNIRINLNHLGEAILGEEEAEKRFSMYLEDLKNPQIEYISVKISTLYSQINQIGFAFSLEKLAERLRVLYRFAKENTFRDGLGRSKQKFVNLDMEEYKDLAFTVDLFQKVLEESEFFDLQAGIVLQSYIPDSFFYQKKLSSWAEKRIEAGGAPIKIRIVKGANLAMETVESSIRGWEKPTFEHKIETDANFKRMLEYGCVKKRADAVHLGIGSHNLLDLAYALVLREEKGITSQVEIEMLHGMAESMRKAILPVSQTMVLYCPEAKEKDFQHAFAYLIRRLDENTAQGHFLRDYFQMKKGSEILQEHMEKFERSFSLIRALSDAPKRCQNRTSGELPPQSETFQNEPDTDFSLEQNRVWALSILDEWKAKTMPKIPNVIGGQRIHGKEREGFDPSRPHTPLYTYSIAHMDEMEKAVDFAKKHESAWGSLPYQHRYDLLGKVADLFRKKRKELIGAMVADGGKTIWEADPEVSEAIDFLEYYRKNWPFYLSLKDVSLSPKGTLLVTPPWNFPCSIPTGSIAAALTAGNCVIFKPAPETVLVGWVLVNLFWEAGVPQEVLQFLNCEEDTVGSALIAHPHLNGVLLTGGTSTALKFMQLNPKLDLNAETGGKNALIITALSDRDLAIKDLVQSAFSHSGQKCSACSLGILEEEVYQDDSFLQQLKDAAASLVVGSAWEPQTRVGPLIRPPTGPLKRGLFHLEPGESWLLEPKEDPTNPHLFTCGIKLGVQKGGFTHQTELFGPVLGLMRAVNLDEAIDLANSTPYGLTAGLHSLDERDHARFRKKIVSGNLYINRTITGAIVGRQPFGGTKASSFGHQLKAGGPNFLVSCTKAVQRALPEEKAPLPESLLPLFQIAASLTSDELTVWKKSCESYAYWALLLKKPQNLAKLIGQDNEFYLVPRKNMVLRVQEYQLLSLLQVVAACMLTETPIRISSSIPLPISHILEDELPFLSKIKDETIRVIGEPTERLLARAAEGGATLKLSPVLANGRLELLHYLREVSLSTTYHRYGYIGGIFT